MTSEYGSDRARVDLVRHEVVELHHVDVADDDLLVDFLAGAAVEERALARHRQLGLLQVLADALLRDSVEHRGCDLHAELLAGPAEVRLKDLPDVHARGHAERVEADLDGGSVGEEGHVLLGHDLGDHALVSVAAGHLVADVELLLGGDVDLDLLDGAVAGALAGLDRADLALALALELVELGLVGADDLHDLDPHRRRVDLDVLGDGGELAQERLGDLAVGRDDDLARSRR